jgi:hypothetical protein
MPTKSTSGMRKRFVPKVLSNEMLSWWSTLLRRCSGVLQKAGRSRCALSSSRRRTNSGSSCALL